jgi:hypothetical protein
MKLRSTSICSTATAIVLTASFASALPVTLKDTNGTKYNINTQVVPLNSLSNASGALTNATFVQPVTVTSYYVAFTPWFFFVTTYTVQRQVNVPLTPAFAGFNSLLIAGMNGVRLTVPLVFNPGQAIAGQDCPDSNGKEKQLIFPTETFSDQNLALTRKVYVPSGQDWVRWLNIVTNTGSSPITPTIGLLGLVASGDQTKIIASSTGDSLLTTADLWFTTSQSVPQGAQSFQPKIGYVVQGPGATNPVTNLGISTTSAPPGKMAFTYSPTIAPGETAIVMTFVTVQGKAKQAKNTCNDIVGTPLPSNTIKCMSEQELSQVVNFARITPPVFKSATVKLQFKKSGQDTVQWKGKITIGAGLALSGLPVAVNFGGVPQTFVLNKSGAGNNGGGNKFNLNADLKKGVTKAGTYSFSFNMKGDLQTPLAQFGLTNADQKNVPVSIPLTMTAGPGVYAVDQPFTYKATEGKTGTATAG